MSPAPRQSQPVVVQGRGLSMSQMLPLLLYAAMIVYVTLFPGTGWRPPPEGPFAWLTWDLSGRISRSDLLANVIAYLPVGFLALRFFRREGRPFPFFLAAVATGCTLSLALEFTQSFLPSRTPSTLDLATNGFGTFAGALAALCWEVTAKGLLGRLRREQVREGREAELALFVLLIWALSQLAPFVPSLDLYGIKNGLKPLFNAATGASPFRLGDFASYLCYLAALGVVAQGALRPGSRPLPLFALFALAVLSAKPFVLGRALSAEALSALITALPVWIFLSFFPEKGRRRAAALFLLAGFTAYELKTGTGPLAERFDWVPFSGQVAGEMEGFGSILEGVWPFTALSLLCLPATGNRRAAALAGAVLVPSLVLFLEWQQLALPGRSPEVTPGILAVAGWCTTCAYLGRKPAAKA